jgi:hypothetical protein
MAAQVASNSSAPLPREIVLSIQRILELQDSDPLDALGDFDPVDTLNQLFPDGGLHFSSPGKKWGLIFISFYLQKLRFPK